MKKYEPNDDNAENPFRLVGLGGKNTVPCGPKDRIVVFSPGGGGYGVKPTNNVQSTTVNVHGVANSVSDDTMTISKLGGGSLSQYVLNQESV